MSDTGSSGGAPRFNENRLDNFNNDGELIGVADAEDIPPVPPLGRVVSRSKISGTSTTVEFPSFPGNPPPDNFTAIKTLRTSGPAFVKGNRTALRTPPTCPSSGHWTNTLVFTYRDGVSQTVESPSPCRPPGSASRCLSPRSPVGARNIGRVRLGSSRARLLGLPVERDSPGRAGDPLLRQGLAREPLRRARLDRPRGARGLHRAGPRQPRRAPGIAVAARPRALPAAAAGSGTGSCA